MKGRKFGGALMLIGAVALVMVGIMSIAAIPPEKSGIEQSVLLKDGMYKGKNAGQKVTLILDYKRLEHGLDEQMDLEFWATLVKKDVEKFQRQKDGSYKWTTVSIDAVDPLKSKTLYGQTDGGDRVSIDPAFEEKITTNENLGVEDLTDWSLKDYKKGRKYKAVVVDDVTYFTNASKAVFGDLEKTKISKMDSQVGKFRVKYTKMDLYQKSVAVTGIQQGHLIKVDPEVGHPIVTGAKANKLFNKADVVDRMIINRVIEFATALICAIVLLFFGLGWMGFLGVRDKRKIMKAADARKLRQAQDEAEQAEWEKGGDVVRKFNDNV